MKTLVIISILMIGNNDTFSFQNEKENLVETFVKELQQSEKTLPLMKKYFPDAWKFMKKKGKKDFVLWKDIQQSIMLDVKLKLGDQDFIVVSKEENPDLFENVLSKEDPNSQFALLAADNNQVITYFLIEDLKISAMSTLDKGMKKVYFGGLPEN